jgi:hypothetical protein
VSHHLPKEILIWLDARETLALLRAVDLYRAECHNRMREESLIGVKGVNHTWVLGVRFYAFFHVRFFRADLKQRFITRNRRFMCRKTHTKNAQPKTQV